jgi:ArsR family transcriptional regulator, arsenate/arsenite/antimonite-responsive transcriptional repressor
MPTPSLSACIPVARATLSNAEAVALEGVFHALADRHRVKMLNILARAGEDVCVCDFQAALGLKQATASYHLRQLVEAGLVERRTRGTYSYYRLVAGAFEGVAALLENR